MKSEIKFSKYEVRGTDYHYRQIQTKNLYQFNAFVAARYLIELKLLSKLIKNSKNNYNEIKILDVGCGDAVILYLISTNLKKFNLKLYGIDSSEIALKIAQKKVQKGIFKKSDVYNLPFKENYFDYIISSDVIEHVSNSNQMLSEIKRVGKNNSYVIIGTPIKHTEKPLDKMHFKEYYPKEFKTLLDEFFQNVSILKTHRLFYLLLYKKIISIFKKKILFYRYLINILSIFLNINPFLRSNNQEEDLYSYMFACGIIKKN